MRLRLGHWSNRYRRIMAMSAQEIADRLKQQTIARVDLLRYKTGFAYEPKINGSTSQRPDPHFFFSPQALPQICAHMRQLFPQECEQIIQRAHRICQHRFDLLGYKDLNYGHDIDWHCDLVHEKRAPRKPWFQIRYLDFSEVGDSKVTWELNRHQHLVTLAKAYLLTADVRFASELFLQWDHWHRENPYPIGINWASSLEVAFRSLSWLWVYFLMSGSETVPKDFPNRLHRSLAISARHIENNLSTYFSPNTHLLGEGAALFFIGTLCPRLPRAARWQTLGWQILQQAAEHQVRADGLHFEQSIYYHVYALDFFLHASILASRNAIALPDKFNRTLEAMLDALCTLGRSGPVPRIGDDDGGRLFDPHRNRTEHLLDPLAIGAVLFRRGDFKTVAAGPREEMLWLLGESGLAEFDRLPSSPAPCTSAAFQYSGLYVASDADLQRQLSIDAGPQGADSAGHGHADALSITANISGHALLIDPGTFEYVGADNSQRNFFRGTRAHNTLVVDELDQSEPEGPFSWASLPNVRREQWINGETFDLFLGSHDGYARLADPVIHRRTVFSLKSRFWLVRDQALGHGEHTLHLFWHLHPELRPQQHNATFRNEDGTFSIITPEGNAWSQNTSQQDCSPAYGEKQTHSVVHFATRATLPAEFATLLLPQLEIDSATVSFVRANPLSNEASVVHYRLKTPTEEHHFIFAADKPWTLLVASRHEWSSDAEFLYWSRSNEKSEKRYLLIGCNSSYIELGGRKIVSSKQKISRCELLCVGGQLQVSCSKTGDDEVKVDREAFAAIFSVVL